MGSCDVVVADPAPLMGDISERAEQSRAEQVKFPVAPGKGEALGSLPLMYRSVRFPVSQGYLTFLPHCVLSAR